MRIREGSGVWSDREVVLQSGPRSAKHEIRAGVHATVADLGIIADAGSPAPRIAAQEVTGIDGSNSSPSGSACRPPTRARRMMGRPAVANSIPRGSAGASPPDVWARYFARIPGRARTRRAHHRPRPRPPTGRGSGCAKGALAPESSAESSTWEFHNDMVSVVMIYLSYTKRHRRKTDSRRRKKVGTRWSVKLTLTTWLSNGHTGAAAGLQSTRMRRLALSQYIVRIPHWTPRYSV